MKALVLSGGGAKGAYEAGLVCSLIEEYGEQFDIICGTSIGAINSAFLAQDDTTALKALWSSIEKAAIVSPLPRILALQNIFSDFSNAYRRRGLAKLPAFAKAIGTTFNGLRVLNPLGELETITGTIDPVHTQQLLTGKLRLNAVKHALITTATDLVTSRPEVFYYFPEAMSAQRDKFLKGEPDALPYSAATFSETIRASGAIPGAFSPVQLPEKQGTGAYVDGGVVNNTPIGQAIDAGATEVTIIYLDPSPENAAVANLPSTMPEILLGCFSIMQQQILWLDYQMAMRVNDAVGANAADTTCKHIVRLRTFRPKSALAVQVLDFDKQDRVDAAFAQGQADARDPALRGGWES
jgi:NTE family protein